MSSKLSPDSFKLAPEEEEAYKAKAEALVAERHEETKEEYYRRKYTPYGWAASVGGFTPHKNHFQNAAT